MLQTHKPVRNKEFKERLTIAWLRYQMLRREEIGQQWLSDEVGRRLNRGPLSQGTISRWFRGAVPDLESICAVAEALEVDPGWLAFGAASKAPAPNEPILPYFRLEPQPEEPGD